MTRRQLMDTGVHRGRPADHPDFAGADEPCVRVKLEKHQLTPRCADDGGDGFGDLHHRPSVLARIARPIAARRTRSRDKASTVDSMCWPLGYRPGEFLRPYFK